MDTVELKDKLGSIFKWDALLENLPGILLAVGGIILLDKLVDIGGKLEPVYKKVKEWNKDAVFEIIDTVGDNIQLLDLILKAVGVDLNEGQLDRLADSLQNLGTVGKHVSRLWSLIAPTLVMGKTGSGKKSFSYKEF